MNAPVPMIAGRFGRRGCLWIMGPVRVGEAPPVTCDMPRRDADCPYCDAHAARAYLSPRKLAGQPIERDVK